MKKFDSTTRSVNSKGRLEEDDNALQEQVRAGVLQAVQEREIETDKCHHTPGQAVIRDDNATTRLRVVMAGAAMWSKSLFDEQLFLQRTECLSRNAVLLRFMLFQVIAPPDIQKSVFSDVGTCRRHA